MQCFPGFQKCSMPTSFLAIGFVPLLLISPHYQTEIPPALISDISHSTNIFLACIFSFCLHYSVQKQQLCRVSIRTQSELTVNTEYRLLAWLLAFRTRWCDLAPLVVVEKKSCLHCFPASTILRRWSAEAAEFS